MKGKTALAAAFAVAALAVAAVGVSAAVGDDGHHNNGGGSSSCRLVGQSGPVQHVIYLQFDNTHYNRDNPNVPSDLEQMPHLLNFLKGDGTLFTNDHTILISHTAGGILSSLTGLYPDQNGQTVSNSYDYFPASKVPTFSSSFKYWTNAVDPVGDPLPNMVTTGGKNTPAPWVPFTRAGCDVGGVGTANIELENASTSATGDITRVFGAGSPEWNEAAANPQIGQTDFVGIAIHCSQSPSSVCANNPNAKPDPLPDEPGGYTGFNALYGTKYVDPAITNGNQCVDDTNGDAITDPIGICGFPGFDGMLAKNTLGYVAQMQENGVPVTYGYISDVHDFHVPVLSSDSYSSSATGPGELAHVQQLKAYDDAFETFFRNLQRHGINRSNTLFVITVDEGDHFAGGVGTPAPGGNWLVYDHRTCTNLSACPSNQIGEVGANMNALLPLADRNPSSGTIKYDIHFDDAPTFYLTGQPGRTDSFVRSFERDVGNLSSLDPYASGGPATVPLTVNLADPVEEQTLHMINADQNRTPTFTMFGNPDFFFQLSNPCSGVADLRDGGVRVEPRRHPAGDREHVGRDGRAGHRPERRRLDDLDRSHEPPADDPVARRAEGRLHRRRPRDRAGARPARPAARAPGPDDRPARGRVRAGERALRAVRGGDVEGVDRRRSRAGPRPTTRTTRRLETSILSLTTQRDALATSIKTALNNAAFNGTPISTSQAQTWIAQANTLITQAQALS